MWLLKPAFNVLKGPEARSKGRGQATPTTATSSASRNSNSQPNADWSPGAHKQSHKNHVHTAGKNATGLLHGHSSATPGCPHAQELTSFPVWVEQHHHHMHTHFTPSLPFLWPHSPHNHSYKAVSLTAMASA